MAYGTNAPKGFQPTSYINGSTWTGQTNEYPIQDAYATTIYYGDPVYLATDGTIIRAVLGTPFTTPLLGIFVGVKYKSTTAAQTNQGLQSYSKYWPGATDLPTGMVAYAQIVDDPNVLFDVQLAGAGSDAVLFTALNKNAGSLAATTGSTLTGESNAAIDYATAAAANPTYSFKIVRFTPQPGNPIPPGNAGTVAYPNVLVKINNHVFGSTGTAGV